MADVDETAQRLARVEHEISKHRLLYLRATWAGHDGEREHHERAVDRLLELHQRIRCGFPYELTEIDAELAGPVSVTSTVVEYP